MYVCIMRWVKLHDVTKFPFIYKRYKDKKDVRDEMTPNNITFEEFKGRNSREDAANAKLVKHIEAFNKVITRENDPKPKLNTLPKADMFFKGPYEILKFLTHNNKIQKKCPESQLVVIIFINYRKNKRFGQKGCCIFLGGGKFLEFLVTTLGISFANFYENCFDENSA